MPEQNTADEHLGVAFVALSNALRELQDSDWEEQVSDHRGDVDDVDDLVVDIPPGGRVVLTSLKRQIESANEDSPESTSSEGET